jgi:acetoin utilization deacetylase AcuC-like enzyme
MVYKKVKFSFVTRRPEAMKKVVVIKDQIYLEHRPDPYHPESPKRLESVYGRLEQKELSDLYALIRPRKASRDEIQRVHTASYFERVAQTAGIRSTFLDLDTQTSEKSFEAALSAAGGILTGIDGLMSGDYTSAFALVRPPGHHAERDRGMGFCLFNNVAVGALYAIDTYSLDRILIIDWDLHHGNGTQHSFSDDSRILYFSVHQFPYYPGTGDFSEVGHGKGKGFTINVPLSIGNGDDDYYKIFKKVLEPVADTFKPQLVLVSAGFDIHYEDPLGGMEVTPKGFAKLTCIVQSIAQKHANGRLLLTLEGGYHLGGLCDGVERVIEQLAGTEKSNIDRSKKNGEQGVRNSDYAIERAIAIQKKFWSCF